MLDIVIPVHNNLAWLRLCLQALHAFTENRYRVTIVDNASDDPETQKFLRGDVHAGCPLHGGVRVLRLATNESFSSSVNAGIRAGDQQYVVILNSDAIVTPGWDAAMIADLVHDEVGITGARTNAASGLQGSLPPEGGRLAAQQCPDNAAMHAGASLGVATQGRSGACSPSAPFLIFFCVALRRKTFEELGPLDGETCVGWGGGEDLDYSWRAIEAGKRLVISSAYVMHGCSMTYRSRGVGAEEKSRLEQINLERLVAKWSPERVRLGLKTQPKVLISVFSRSEQTWRLFVQSLMAAMKWAVTNGWDVGLTWATRTMIHLAREQVADLAVKLSDKSVAAGGVDYDYVLFLDDDHTFPANAFFQLVSSGKDVVGALAYRRSTNQRDPTRADHRSCAFRWVDPVEKKLADTIEGFEHTGLQRVDAIGFGMTAVKLDVIRAMKAAGLKALFEFYTRGEDIDFCAKATDLGAEVWCDTDLILGHIGDPVIVDEQYVQRWKAEAAAAGGLRLEGDR